MKTTIDILREAGAVRRRAATLTAEEKNRALTAMADALLGGTKRILEANCGDVERAKGQIPEVMIDRLSLSESRIAAMAEGVRAIAALEDAPKEELPGTGDEDPQDPNQPAADDTDETPDPEQPTDSDEEERADTATADMSGALIALALAAGAASVVTYRRKRS